MNEALAYLRENDTLIVWKLGRSMTHLLQSVADLEARGIGFRSLTEAIDTTTPTGRLSFGIFAALVRERTMAGLQAARARGRKGGRKFALNEFTNIMIHRFVLLWHPMIRGMFIRVDH